MKDQTDIKDQVYLSRCSLSNRDRSIKKRTLSAWCTPPLPLPSRSEIPEISSCLSGKWILILIPALPNRSFVSSPLELRERREQIAEVQLPSSPSYNLNFKVTKTSEQLANLTVQWEISQIDSLFPRTSRLKADPRSRSKSSGEELALDSWV